VAQAGGCYAPIITDRPAQPAPPRVARRCFEVEIVGWPTGVRCWEIILRRAFPGVVVEQFATGRNSGDYADPSASPEFGAYSARERRLQRDSFRPCVFEVSSWSFWTGRAAVPVTASR